MGHKGNMVDYYIGPSEKCLPIFTPLHGIFPKLELDHLMPWSMRYQQARCKWKFGKFLRIRNHPFGRLLVRLYLLRTVPCHEEVQGMITKRSVWRRVDIHSHVPICAPSRSNCQVILQLPSIPVFQLHNVNHETFCLDHRNLRGDDQQLLFKSLVFSVVCYITMRNSNKQEWF